MKIITNEKLIKRNRKVWQILTGGSLVILAVGLVISFTMPDIFLLSWVALILGLLLSQIGIYFGNRWGRRPRPDETLTASLKGMDDRFTLVHYASPIPHLLIAPNSLWALIPYPQKGRISISRNRYRQSGGNIVLKFFGQEGLGRPDVEASDQVKEIRKALLKVMPEEALPAVNPVVVFTADEVVLEVDEAPVPTTSAKKLKELIRKRLKENQIAPDQMQKIVSALVREVS